MRGPGDTLYRLILHAFPRGFRQRHGDAMAEQFGIQRRAVAGRPAAIVTLWARALVDSVRHGFARRLESGRRRRRWSRGSVMRSAGWLVDWTGDVRKTVRGLGRQPAFAMAAVATLTLGTGANAAVFALAWHTTFRPLPYRAPEQLVQVFEAHAAMPGRLSEVSPASLRAWAERVEAFEAVGTFGRSRVIFPADDNGAMARYQSLSPGVFAALGVRPLLGRVVLTDADRKPDEVVLSYEYWQRRFGGDPGVIDRLHRFADVGDDPERIIGVMPPGFMFLDRADIWAVNLSYSHGTIGRSYRSLRQDSVLARVRPGRTAADAAAEVARVSSELAAEFPDTHAGWTPVVVTLHETVVGKYRAIALLLVAAACAVFLVACTNVAGLLVMRASSRRHEVSLRLALGASRWRVIRLWLFEGLVVAAISLVAGLLVARWLVGVLAAIAPASVPRLDQVVVSWPTIVVGAVAALAFVAVYAAAPLTAGVLAAGRVTTGGTSGTRTVAAGGRGRAVLLAAQSGLAVVLLTGAVLLSTSLQRLYEEPLGFDPSGVLSVRLSPYYAGNRRPWALSADMGRALEERLAQHQAVSHAAVATTIPLEDVSGDQVFRIEGDPSGQHWGAIQQSASPGYLDTLGLTLVEGRWFTRDDAFTADRLLVNDRTDQVAVITETMARTLWPNESAVGKRLLSVVGDPNAKRIVGVVGDLKFQGANQPASFRLFLPWNQQPGAGNLAVFVKAKGDPRVLAADVGAIAREIQPGTGVHPARTLEELFQASTADTRLAASLVGGFSVLALLLTAVGVFGLVGYSIAERRRELAVRLALGARRANISATAAASGFIPVLVGAGCGLVAAFGSVQMVQGLLFGVDPLSPSHYVVAGGVLLAVAALAAAAPLRRLLVIDPAEALRVD
jgi:predicted permease